MSPLSALRIMELKSFFNFTCRTVLLIINVLRTGVQ